MSILVDQTTIYVRAGKGGDGCMSFRREKYVPKGGPDGGNGGDGGSIFLVGDPGLDTLVGLASRPHFRARNGSQGTGKSMTGAAGPDLEVPVPLGTVIHERETGGWVADIQSNEPIIVARGGKGGLGNEHFKSSTNQAPRENTPGEVGEEFTLDLELKLIADIGLIGLPNAGKSTLLSVVSRATPKIADYPFTTLQPHLGIAELPDDRRLVFADIPGLVEGAAQGAGLGHDFLRHIERTQVLVHLIDTAPLDGSDPITNYETIRRELFEHSVHLAEKPEIIVFNKIDLLAEEDVTDVTRRFRGRVGLKDDDVVLTLSGATRQGVAEMLEVCWQTAAKIAPAGWES